ncbi:MAG TPA: tRNA pseudouridine(55) synthase TruB [Candidatus Onthoplasma faecipullorum]|nr:tRNA pseudouridine(55) synthase TruB [Candidatus Onthoplasma faecipullorum]
MTISKAVAMKNKGVIVINKPTDWTSFDVVNKIKRLIGLSRVGHLGTLDPMATGVLLVTIGKATKLFDIMQEKKKTYVATFHFGEETNTLDSTGKITNSNNKIVTRKEIEAILNTFVGEISQIPPKYSAKSVNGVRAYMLARKNEDFVLPAKVVKIYELKIIDFNDNILTLEITCGSGTYIRALGRDIAYKLNTYATMISLVRTKVGKFDLNQSIDIKSLTKDNIENYILPIDSVLDYNKIELSDINTKKILNGQTIKTDLQDGTYKLNNELDTIALIQVHNSNAKMSLFLG